LAAFATTIAEFLHTLAHFFATCGFTWIFNAETAAGFLGGICEFIQSFLNGGEHRLKIRIVCRALEACQDAPAISNGFSRNIPAFS